MVSLYNFVPKMPQGKKDSWKNMIGSGWDKYFEHVIAGIVFLLFQLGALRACRGLRLEEVSVKFGGRARIRELTKILK